MTTDFIEKIKSFSKYFVGWKENYTAEKGYYESFRYTKDDHFIRISIDNQGWRGILEVKSKDKMIAYIMFGECVELSEELDKNDIRKRILKQYKTNSKAMHPEIDLYIEFLVENGILTKPDDTI